MTDLDIAKTIELKHIRTIAQKLGLNEDEIEMYGHNKAKLPLSIIDNDKAEILIAENVKVEVIKSTGIQALLNTPEVKK